MKVVIPSPLFSYTGGQRVVEGEGVSLTHLLDGLDARFPGMRHRIIDEQGRMRPHIRVFVNGEQAASLGQALVDRDEVLIVAALSGGDHAPYANRESLGRLAFNVAMIAVAVLLVVLLRRGSPLMQLVQLREPRAWVVRLHGLWFTVLVALPLAMAVLAGMGTSGRRPFQARAGRCSFSAR
jgi:molybdopterin converting factor small subunit